MKEFDVRPRALFDNFLANVAEDASRLFGDHSTFVSIPCPACADDHVEERFTKLGFEYRLCGGCESLYVSPRPPADLFERFYRDSKSIEYFASSFYRETENNRRDKIFRPRAAVVAEFARHLNATESLADIGAGFGTFLEEVLRTKAFDRVVAVEPAAKLAAVCRAKKLDVLEMPVEQAVGRNVDAAFVTCFEVFEHVHDPLAFLQALGGVARPGGVVLFTTLTISGFDLQELWDRSKSIVPPHHINLLSTKGLERLVARAGFELVDLATPGQLDVDIVRNMFQEIPELTLSRFAKCVVQAPDGVRDEFQRFLQQHRLSSHARVVARRPA